MTLHGQETGSTYAAVSWRSLVCAQTGDTVGSGRAGADLVRRAVLGGGQPEGVRPRSLFRLTLAAGLHRSSNLHLPGSEMQSMAGRSWWI